jgi:hypothetical protein
MGDKRNAYRVLVIRPFGRRLLERRSLEDNVVTRGVTSRIKDQRNSH